MLHLSWVHCARRSIAICRQLALMCTAHANGDLVLRMLPERGQKESLEASLGDPAVGTVSSDTHASIVVSARGSRSS